MICLVAAMATNHTLGKQGGLPWKKLGADLRHFKDLTIGHPVIMGRVTYDTLPPRFRPLPGRTNIVVTHNPDYAAPGALVVGSLTEAYAQAKSQPGSELVCVIGGAKIYAQALAQADRLYLTRVNADLEGDAFFPELGSEWQLTETVPFPKNEANDYDGTFETYHRTGR